MARTVDVAAHARRRTEFLDAAERLIESSGYGPMSIKNVLDETGASRGAFYHYFETKHELLSAVVDRLVDTVVELLEPVAADLGLTPMQQLQRVFAELSDRKGRDREALVATLRVWYSEGNVMVRQRFRVTIIDRMAGVLARIVARGDEDGVFAVPDARQAGVILATLLQDLNDALADKLFLTPAGSVAPSAAELVVDAHVWAIERVLGVPDGSTALIDTAALLYGGVPLAPSTPR